MLAVALQSGSSSCSSCHLIRCPESLSSRAPFSPEKLFFPRARMDKDARCHLSGGAAGSRRKPEREGRAGPARMSWRGWAILRPEPGPASGPSFERGAAGTCSHLPRGSLVCWILPAGCSMADSAHRTPQERVKLCAMPSLPLPSLPPACHSPTHSDTFFSPPLPPPSPLRLVLCALEFWAHILSVIGAEIQGPGTKQGLILLVVCFLPLSDVEAVRKLCP